MNSSSDEFPIILCEKVYSQFWRITVNGNFLHAPRILIIPDFIILRSKSLQLARARISGDSIVATWTCFALRFRWIYQNI